MTLPFGKYKRKSLESIPDEYLVWVLDNVKDLSPTLRRAVEQRLGIVANDAKSATGGLSVVTAVAGQWYRQLAREFHPDSGGSHAAMVAINRGRDLLLELTGATG